LIQEVSGVYTSLSLNTDCLKMAFRSEKILGLSGNGPLGWVAQNPGDANPEFKLTEVLIYKNVFHCLCSVWFEIIQIQS